MGREKARRCALSYALVYVCVCVCSQELVAEKLKGYEREHKELHMLLFPEVS